MLDNCQKMLVPLGMLALLPSCQPPPPVVLAALEAGEIVFHVRRTGFPNRIFGWDDRKYQLGSLEIRLGSHVYWSIKLNTRAARRCTPTANFPLSYGEIPCGYVQIVDAAKLDHGGPYLINADISRGNRVELSREFPAGRFMIHVGGGLDNIRPE